MQGQPLLQAGGLSSITVGVTVFRQLQMGEAFASSKRCWIDDDQHNSSRIRHAKHLLQWWCNPAAAARDCHKPMSATGLPLLEQLKAVF